MVVQVVEKLGCLVELVDHTAETKCVVAREDVDGVPFQFEEVFQERHSWVG